MASQINSLIATLSLLLLGAAPAWAGRGDIDPNYGEGGRLTARRIYYGPTVSSLVASNLPDDRLITVEEGLVRRFDPEGRLDPTFGDNGETAIPAFPDATPFFEVLSNPIPTPDGGFIIAGLLRDGIGAIFFETLIRLDRDGRLVTSFGGGGDGIYRLSAEPLSQDCGGICGALMGIAVDSYGRVLLAKRSWDAPGHCSAAARVERLTPDGAIDSTFDVDGGIDLPGVDLCGGALVFGARNDDSIVVGGGGVVIGLDATGARDATFGTTGQLSLASSVGWSSGLLMPDGNLLLAGSSAPSQAPSESVLAKFDRSGQPDLSFGDGTGVTQRDLGEAFFGMSGLQPHVSAVASTSDGGQLYLQVSMTRTEPDAVCAGGIARLHGDGSIDTTFGERGLTCLDYGAFPFELVGLQRDGAPLFGRVDGNFYRLLLGASASPGFLTLARTGNTHEVGEGDGSATLSVVRAAGRDGAISAHFYTREAPRDPRCYSPCSTAHIARAGSDYQSATGRLEWADGERGPHPINVDILDDLAGENREIFLVSIEDLQGGVRIYGDDRFIVGINDDDDSAQTGNDDDGAAKTDDAPAGGGGSTSWYVIAALAALAAFAARARRQRSAARRIARIVSLPCLLLLASAAAWAGRGDIDPNYGEGGRQPAGEPSVVFPLTGDRLLISEWHGTGYGVHLRMLDAAGQLIPSFGDGGAVVIDSSARAPYFQAGAAALAPNGDIVFLGWQWGDAGEQTLLRVDGNGQPVPSFGTDGDGFVVLNSTTTTRVITIDPDGRIVLVEGSVDADNNCVTTARLQRLLADGQPDAAFGGDGLVEIPELNTCYGTTVFGARADGSVVVGDDDSTIVAVDAAGNIDPAFGTEGRFQVAGLASARSLLLPDGSLLAFGSSTDTGASDTVFRKYDRNGQPDLAFGSGSGSVTVDLGTAFLGDPSAREVIDQLALDPDGEHVVAQLSLSHADGSLACSGIARLAIDGTPDATFGRNGLTCLNFYSAVIAVQSNGAPLIFLANHGFIGRLLPDNTPSPGLLRVTSGRVDVDESAGTSTLSIERLAGLDGAVSASFTTTDRRVRHCSHYYFCVDTDGAAAGSDYTANSGQLDWGDGDDGERTVTVSILDDARHENVETFGVDFSEPGGGALLFAESLTVYITDNDVAPPPPPPPPPPPDLGGGGSVSWATALALLGLLLLRRREGWQRAACLRLHGK